MIKHTKINEELLKHDEDNSQLASAFIDMNIDAIAQLLNDDFTISNQTKWEFLADIRDTFKRMRERDTNSLELEMGKCTNCFKGCDVYIFREVKYASKIALYIEEGNEGLQTLQICKRYQQ